MKEESQLNNQCHVHLILGGVELHTLQISIYTTQQHHSSFTQTIISQAPSTTTSSSPLLFATILNIIIQKKLTPATNATRKCAGTNRKFVKEAGSHKLQYFLSSPFSFTSVTYFCNASLFGWLYINAFAM
mmetsp:Transcript_24189/g.36656  ORF Transcript_24189/g.36656 Transcript_24189/m.36656 type:complete len:130 (+) Transcript_24189:2-391(+)